MERILFLINNLSMGGAEKVLVNLANNLDKTKFDITVMTLFDVGINKKFLSHDVHYISCFRHMLRGNSHFLKILSPHTLHKMLIKEKYDIEVSFLEGSSARIISGCRNPSTKLYSWIHVEQHTRANAARAFRSYSESKKCYERFDHIICVSEYVRHDFLSLYPNIKDALVRYNTNETEKILQMKNESIDDMVFRNDEFNLVAVGKLMKNKGFDRLARIVKRVYDDGIPIHLYALGEGPMKPEIQQYLNNNNIQEAFTFLGYKTNPYKYVAKCDIFVCASLAEGFSTAATEALIVGTPVCTVDVSGMKELLGENNEWGIVTDNTEEALYRSIKQLIDNPDLLHHYQRQAVIRGKMFDTKTTVGAVEELLRGMMR